MKNILLIDDCCLIRYALSNLINANSDLRVTAQVRDLNDPGDRIKNESFDIVVLDVSIPRKNGLETVSAIKHTWRNVPILILSGKEQPEYAINFLKLGCKGYLTRRCDQNQVIEAINTVISGRRCIMPATLRFLIEHALKMNKVLDGLSAREIQVFFKLVLGQSTECIVKDLNITPSTISVFRSNIMRKMSFKSNADIIHYALENHLVEFSN